MLIGRQYKHGDITGCSDAPPPAPPPPPTTSSLRKRNGKNTFQTNTLLALRSFPEAKSTRVFQLLLSVSVRCVLGGGGGGGIGGGC